MMARHIKKVAAEIAISVPSGDSFAVLEHVVWQSDPVRRQPLGALRPDAGSPESAAYLAIFPETGSFEHEDIVHGDHVAFDTCQFRDPRHLACAIGEAC